MPRNLDELYVHEFGFFRSNMHGSITECLQTDAAASVCQRAVTRELWLAIKACDAKCPPYLQECFRHPESIFIIENRGSLAPSSMLRPQQIHMDEVWRLFQTRCLYRWGLIVLLSTGYGYRKAVLAKAWILIIAEGWPTRGVLGTPS